MLSHFQKYTLSSSSDRLCSFNLNWCRVDAVREVSLYGDWKWIWEPLLIVGQVVGFCGVLVAEPAFALTVSSRLVMKSLRFKRQAQRSKCHGVRNNINWISIIFFNVNWILENSMQHLCYSCRPELIGNKRWICGNLGPIQLEGRLKSENRFIVKNVLAHGSGKRNGETQGRRSAFAKNYCLHKTNLHFEKCGQGQSSCLGFFVLFENFRWNDANNQQGILRIRSMNSEYLR